MNVRKALAFLMVLTVTCLAVPQASPATLNGNIATVALTFTVAESLTVSATPATVDLGTPPTITITTNWNVSSSRVGQTVHVAPYFSSSTALTAGSNSIPASAISCTFDGGSAVPFAADTTGVLPAGSFDCGGSSFAGDLLTASNLNTASSAPQVDSLKLSTPSGSIVPGAYSGTLNITVYIS